MFLSHYGLREQPFGVTPDPRYLYLGEVHREALASLIYGVETGLGFASLIAQPGTGKTTLLYYLLQYYRERARTAFLFDSQCDSRELLRSLLLEFELDASGSDTVTLSGRFRDFLIAQARARRRVIVVLDEAQNFEDSVLETVRLLSNFETPGAKLLHIILSGQPQLAEKLLQPHLLNVRQRISMATRLRAFQPADVARYVAHRLKIAGFARGELFTSDALVALARLSAGIPREINRICFNAMSLACALERGVIDAGTINEAAQDFDFSKLLAPTTSTDESAAHVGLAEVFAAEMASDTVLDAALPYEAAQPNVSAVARSTGEQKREAVLTTANSDGAAAAACAVREPELVRAADTGAKRLRFPRTVQACAALTFFAIAAFAITRPAIRRATAGVPRPAEHKVVSAQIPVNEAALTPATLPVISHEAATTPNVRRELVHRRHRAARRSPHDAVAGEQSSTRALPLFGDAGDGRPVSIVKRVAPPSPTSDEPVRLGGEVAVDAEVGTDGRVLNATAVTGLNSLRDVAANTVRQWVFEPRIVDGESQPMRVRVRLWVTR